MPTPILHQALYLPRILLQWQSEHDAGDHRRIDGTLVLGDVSGFTQLSEELAARGRIGSEQVTGILNGVFSELLEVTAVEGGDLLTFGGDALLLLFHGRDHAARAAGAAFDMRDVVDSGQQPSISVPLAMSLGMASGAIELVVAGSTSRELLVVGKVVDEVIAMEKAADGGEILVAASTISLLDPAVLGKEKAGGRLLDDAPDLKGGPDDQAGDRQDRSDDRVVGTANQDPGAADDQDPEAADDQDPEAADDQDRTDFAAFIPLRLRKHLSMTFNEGEHRTANIAFVRLGGLGPLLASDGLAGATGELDRMVAATQDIADRYRVSFLASDVAPDGATLILATGVPERLEDEEERILRASSEISRLPGRLTVRLGIARGQVFAGDLGSWARRVYTVIGDTVNLAARLAAAANDGTALVVEAVHERSSRAFDVTPLAPLALKGIAEPVTPLLLGAMTGPGATSSEADYPLIGRGRELEVLLDAVAAATNGHGSVVDIAGPPGIGKTRLVRELLDVATVRTVTAVGEPSETATAYHLVGQLVRHALDLPSDLQPVDLGTALAAVAACQSPDLRGWLPLIARVIGAEVQPTAQVDALDDAFQASKTDDVIAQLLAMVLTEPTLLVVDSAEWMDAASQRTLLRLVSDTSLLPWLIVVTHRRRGAWTPPAEAATLELVGLTPDDARKLVADAAGEVALPVPTVDAVVARSDGTPFFLLALVQAAADGDARLPESVEAAVASRIDRLDLRDRQVLRYAAVLGRRFSIDLLVAVAPDLSPVLGDATVWDRLGEFLETTSPGDVRFHQPLMRDAAYAGLPFSRRRKLHAAIGEALEKRARRHPERFAEQLSLHFAEAGEDTKAWRYSVLAAQRARAMYANVVAVDLYRRALDAASNLDAAAIDDDAMLTDDASRADVAEALGDVAERAGLLDDAGNAYQEAMALCGSSNLRRARLLRKSASVNEETGEYDLALTTAHQALDLLTGPLDADAGPRSETANADGEHDRVAEQLDTMLLIAGVLNRKSEPEESVSWCLRALALAERGSHDQAVAHACNLLETNYTDLNHPDRGSAYGRALEIYRRVGDLVGEAKVLNNLGYDAYFLGDWSSATTNWRASATASSRAGDVVTEASVRNNLAEVDIDRGLLDQARPVLDENMRVWRGTRVPMGVAHTHANVGRVDARTGHLDAALEHLDLAEAGFIEVGAPLGVIDVHGRRGEAHLVRGDWRRGLGCIESAVADAGALPGSLVLQAGLHRLRGQAMAQAGRLEESRIALDTALGLARESKARFEEGLTLHVLSQWADAAGVRDDWADEAQAILDDLGVITPPPVPMTPSPSATST